MSVEMQHPHMTLYTYRLRVEVDTLSVSQTAYRTLHVQYLSVRRHIAKKNLLSLTKTFLFYSKFVRFFGVGSELKEAQCFWFLKWLSSDKIL